MVDALPPPLPVAAAQRVLSSRNSLSARRDSAPSARKPTPPGAALSRRPSVGSTGSLSSARRQGSSDPLAQHGYMTLGPIAAGAFSQIARARHSGSRREVAVKTFNKQKCVREMHLAQAMKNELDVLKLLGPGNHPHIANLVDLLDTKNSIHCVLEYAGGGSLQRQLQCRGHAKGLTPPEAANVTAQLGSALAFMHGMGVAHRDVKPENILFVDSALRAVKLCDFGFAIHCGGRKLRTVCGSPQYMAPELSRKESYPGPPVDMWALAAMVYEMLHGKPAFRGNSMEQLGIRIMRVSHESYGPEAPSAARSFIKGGLVHDAAGRFTAAECIDHPWVVDHRVGYSAPPAAVPQATGAPAAGPGDGAVDAE